jgi:hypothetical protein
MFFADPIAAFGNLRTALRTGGKIGFVTGERCAKILRGLTWGELPVYFQ